VFIIGQLPRSFPSMVFLGNGLLVFRILLVLVLVVHVHSPSAFVYSRVQSRSAFTVSRDTKHVKRHTSTALFPPGCGSFCLVLLLCMAPGCACTTAAVHHCLRSCHDGALFPWPPPCWPWPVFVLEVPMPVQVGPVFGLGLRWQRPGCSWLHGTRPSSLP
jgi:hypothetical protein